MTLRQKEESPSEGLLAGETATASPSSELAHAMLKTRDMTLREAAKYKWWVSLAPTTIPFAGFIIRVRTAMNNQIPLGYQDESGFHFGAEPTEKRPNLPPLS
ncbi:MAG: hypothetical protein ACLQSR_00235 [Limisphaerales bacterium]